MNYPVHKFLELHFTRIGTRECVYIIKILYSKYCIYQNTIGLTFDMEKKYAYTDVGSNTISKTRA